MIVTHGLTRVIPHNAKVYVSTTITVVNAIIYAYQTARQATQENVKELKLAVERVPYVIPTGVATILVNVYVILDISTEEEAYLTSVE